MIVEAQTWWQPAGVDQLATKPLPEQLVDVDLGAAVFHRDRPLVLCAQEAAERFPVAAFGNAC